MSIISRWQVFDSQIHQWGLRMYWFIKQSTSLEALSPFGNQIIIAIRTLWLFNGFFQAKGFRHILHQPTLRFIFFADFWNSEGTSFIPPFCRGRNSDFQLRSWVTYINKAYWRQRKESQQLFHFGAPITWVHSLRNTTPWIQALGRLLETQSRVS